MKSSINISFGREANVNKKTTAIVLGNLTAVLVSFNTYGAQLLEAPVTRREHYRANLSDIRLEKHGIERKNIPWNENGESAANLAYDSAKFLRNGIDRTIEERHDFKSSGRNLFAFAIAHSLYTGIRQPTSRTSIQKTIKSSYRNRAKVTIWVRQR
ncbi:MAG: hypothetical protein LBU35_01950 [Holosporales bacterium]|jgi:hypothetical protein|nr:hypothetical protein [Holosporales bacterium]